MSKSSIINQALGELGLDQFATFEENTKPEDYLDSAIKDVFSEFDWSAGLKLLSLSQLNEKGIFGYQYVFNLPNDLIRLIDAFDTNLINYISSYYQSSYYQVSDFQMISNYLNVYCLGVYQNRNNLYAYSIMGNKLYANLPNISLLYVGTEELARLPRYLESLIAVRLAFLLANFYDSDRSKIDMRYQIELARAKSLDSSHSSQVSSFLDYKDYAKLTRR